jgi:hypothetical protein
MEILTHLPSLPTEHPFWNAETMEFLQAVAASLL